MLRPVVFSISVEIGTPYALSSRRSTARRIMRSKCPGRSAIDFIPVYGINRGRSSLSTSFELKLPQAGVGSTWPKVQRIARVVDRQVEPPQYAESDEPIGFAE